MFNWLKEIRESFRPIPTEIEVPTEIEENEMCQEEIDKLKESRGTYQTFLKCKSCSFTWEISVPKGCRYSNKWGYITTIIDEKEGREFRPSHTCSQCETSVIRHCPEIVK